MSSRPELKLAWCSYEAAKYACERWHYSSSMPAGKAVRLGVWEGGVYIGVVVFARGASDAIGKPYGLAQTEVCELARVALRDHVVPVSRILAVALQQLVKTQPGLRLVVSYADPAVGHHGGIYQATNWYYVGDTQPDYAIIDRAGKRWHSRMVSATGYKRSFGDRIRAIRPDQGTRVNLPGKHKYLYPLDADMRERIKPLAKPYPKRASEVGYSPSKGEAAVRHRPGRSSKSAKLAQST